MKQILLLLAVLSILSVGCTQTTTNNGETFQPYYYTCSNGETASDWSLCPSETATATPQSTPIPTPTAIPLPTAVCGNSICEMEESCSSCSDCKCETPLVCCPNDIDTYTLKLKYGCVKPRGCTKDEDCNDNNIATEDKCENAGSCNATCSHVEDTVLRLKSNLSSCPHLNREFVCTGTTLGSGTFDLKFSCEKQATVNLQDFEILYTSCRKGENVGENPDHTYCVFPTCLTGRDENGKIYGFGGYFAIAEYDYKYLGGNYPSSTHSYKLLRCNEKPLLFDTSSGCLHEASSCKVGIACKFD